MAAPALNFPDTELEPLVWSELGAWANDDHAAAFVTFRASCKAVISQRKPTPFASALKPICRRALHAGPLKDAAARAFFEAHFRPVRISKLGDPQGFLTGYYEPVVDGSRVASANYNVPMHARPRDLVALGHRRKAGAFPNNGRVGRRVGRRQFAAYYDRGQIEDGALKGRKLEICYLKDPIDAFFIHIQGSARVRLQDGGVLRLNYDAHNGHPYTPVGRILIERNIVSKAEMSMERIRQFMLANPAEARELRRQNRSYIFFRVTKLADHEEARGAQGVPLTAGRSIAVDKALHAYGTPFWIEAELPIASEAPTTPFRRLLIAQDTGSAIVGPARADIYFGAGADAGLVAGRIRHPGRFVMLVPRTIDPVEAAKKMPIPRAKPSTDTVQPLAQKTTTARPPPRPTKAKGKRGKPAARPRATK